MYRGIVLLTFFFCSAGVFYSAREYIAVQHASQLLAEIESALSGDRVYLPQQIDTRVKAVSPMHIEGATLYHALGILYQRVAEQATRSDAADYYCKSLVSYQNALIARPQKGRYLADWANVRQLLGSHPCPGVASDKEYSEALSYALHTNPVDPEIYFTAGLLHFWSNKKSEALHYFHDFLQYTTEITPVHEEYIVSAVQSPEELTMVIPPRFPHVVRWASIFRARKSRLFDKYQSTFGSLQEAAIQTLTRSYRSGDTPLVVYQGHLTSLFDFVATDRTRRMLDAAYGEFLSEHRGRRYAEFFLNRSKLQELDRVLTWIPSDRRPLTSQLALWGRSEFIVFDTRGKSVGFYLPDSQRVKQIELLGLKGGHKLDVSQVRLYVSNDNAKWLELPIENRVHSFVLDRYPRLIIEPAQSDFLFWKIHYSGPGQGQFSNYIDRLVRLYGRSTRRGGGRL